MYYFCQIIASVFRTGVSFVPFCGLYMNNNRNNLIYKPSAVAIVMDLLMLTTSVFLTLYSYSSSTGDHFSKYYDITVFYLVVWFMISYVFKRYSLIKSQKYVQDIYTLFWTTLTVFLIIGFFFITPLNKGYSILVIIAYSFINILTGTVYYIIQFSIRNAIEYNESDEQEEHQAETASLSEKSPQLNKKSSDILIQSVTEFSSLQVYDFISTYINFKLKNNYISFASNYFEIKSRQEKKFSNIAVFNRLNYVRGINKLFSIANMKLPMNGLFMCNFEQRSTRKKRIYDKYPPGINCIAYFLDYLTKRVIPKMFVARKIYYDVTKGKDRVLSKTEVLGRLVYCGFDIVDVKKINSETYVIARKVKKLDEILESKPYGALLKLRRVGKNGKVFEVLKFRTMYPYAEYIQSYIYKHSSLQKGGKFNRDMRVSTMGKFMRTYWIDEMPMLINLLRGEMKIVGVRPLSQQYFSLYRPELQKKRTKYRPGLLPPFYADLPETLDEIQESELRYLRQCEKFGTFLTDIQYIIKILRNIIIHKARSA